MVPSLHTDPALAVVSGRPSHSRFAAPPRLLVLAALLTVETVLVSLWLDNGALASRAGFLSAFLARWGAWTLRGIVGAAAMFVTFAYLKNRAALAGFSAAARRQPVRLALLVVHACALAVFAAVAWALYGNHLGPVPENLAAAAFLAAYALAMICAACAFIAPALWIRLLGETVGLWLPILPAIAAACVAGAYFRQLWAPAGRLTFALVEFFLRPFVSRIVADTTTMTLGSGKFSVEIAPECSGFEGAGLILAFGILWLFLFRKECRFPQALLLLPAGVVTIYLLNAVRIAALILIGDAGAKQVALGGFHSQAGWIAFTCVALGFTVAARRVSWISNAPREPRIASSAAANPTAAYLLPFLSILAAGMLTTAVSAGFEWLYPVRLAIAAAVLWTLRSAYRGLGWKPGIAGAAIGVSVFALWIAADAALHHTGPDPMPAPLAASSTAGRFAWIACRILAATITVPLAEELAFRGFLTRRFVSPDFETVPLRRFTWLGLCVSAGAFGLLHGTLWPAGIAAGFLYNWAVIRRGRIGDAVLAHSVTNALLAAYVLLFHQWHLW